MVDLGEDKEKFDAFMAPLTLAFENLGSVLLNSTNANCNSEEVRKTVIGLARDLRGLAFAFNTKTSYMMLFDVSSPNGILLFREASKIICSYGNRILDVIVAKEQMYPLNLKGISICFSMLKAALCGSYVNFGVFRLYGDEALDNALNTFVTLLLSIPQTDLLDYPKLSQTYYVLLECLAQDHMAFLATLEPQVFLYILASISEGLQALDTMVCTGCCATLDHIVTYLFKKVTNKGKKSRSNNP